MRDTKGNDMLKKWAWIDLFVALIAVLLLSACWNSKREMANPPFPSQTASDNGVPTLRVTATITETVKLITPTVELIITPEITATPVVSESKDLGEIIRKLFPLFASPKCTLDILRTVSTEIEKPVLKISTHEGSPFSQYLIKEIAYNHSHTKMAVIACRSQIECFDHLFVKDVITGKVSDITWIPRDSYRPIGNIIWIGDDLLSVMEQTGIPITDIAVIDFEQEKFVLFWRNYNRCEP